MQIAEQIGSTFANACVIDKKVGSKHPFAVPVAVNSSHDDYVPMELGTVVTF